MQYLEENGWGIQLINDGKGRRFRSYLLEEGIATEDAELPLSEIPELLAWMQSRLLLRRLGNTRVGNEVKA